MQQDYGCTTLYEVTNFMKKTICTLFFVLVLALTFAGCGGNNQNKNNNNDKPQASSSAESTPSTQSNSENKNEGNNSTQGSTGGNSNNGTVEDRDGIIGNEKPKDNDDFSIDIYDTTAPSVEATNNNR